MASIVIVIPNQNHVFPVNAAGNTTTIQGSGTDVEVYVDKQKATPVSTIDGNLQFTVTVQQENNVRSGNITIDSANKRVIIGNVNAGSMRNFSEAQTALEDSMAKGTVTLLIRVSDENGEITQATRELTYKKSARYITAATDVEVGTVIAVSNTLYSQGGASNFSVPQWYRDGQEVEQGTSYTITNDDVGSIITASITFTKANGEEKTVFIIKNVNVIDSLPINTPIITGTPAIGQTLEVDTSFIYDRNEIGDITTSWYVNNQLVLQNSSSYTIPEVQTFVGDSVKVISSYTDGAGTLNNIESPTLYIYDSSVDDVVTIDNDQLLIDGQAEVGTQLSASIEVASGAQPENVEYQWRRNGKIIPNQNGSSYSMRRADTGKEISLTVRYEVNGTQRMKASNRVSFKNSNPSGQPYISFPVSEEGTISVMPSDVAIGEQLEVVTTNITDLNDIKDFYYPFDDLVQQTILSDQDKLTFDSLLQHSVIEVDDTFIPGLGLKEEEKDIIQLQQEEEIQSIWINSRFANFSDIITIQYLDSNGNWSDAVSVTGPFTGMKILEESITASQWRAKYQTEQDNILFNYSLEAPSTEETRNFIYQWFRVKNGSTQAINGAVDKKYTVKSQDVDSTLKVRVYFTDGANQTKYADSTNTVQVSGYAFAGSIVIDGTARVGGILEVFADITDADNVTVDNVEGTVHYIDRYEWFANGQLIQDQENSTLVIDEDLSGKTISAKLYYTDLSGIENSANAQNTVVVNSPVTGTPYIVGTPKVGRTLTLNTSNVVDDNGISQRFYRWLRIDDQGNEEEIENAGTQEYIVRSEDVTKQIRGVLYFTDLDGFSELVSSSPITIQDSATTGEPTITGLVVAGLETTADVSGISDDNGIKSISYQWRINEQEISGATGQTFQVPESSQISADSVIDVVTQVTDNNDIVKTLYSDAKRIATLTTTLTPQDNFTLTDNDLTVEIPQNSVQEDINIVIYETNSEEFTNMPEGSTITGSAWVLTPHGTTFDNPITLTFTVPEDSNVVLRADNESSPYFEIVENASIANNTATVETNTFSVYVPAKYTPAIVSGTPEQGYYLTASVLGDTVNDLTFQWNRDNVQITDATDSTYLVQLEDVNKNITVDATFSDETGVTFTRTSDSIYIINSPMQGDVIITGSLRVGSVLTAIPTNISDRNLEGTPNFEYQWKRNNLIIEDQTNSQYTAVEEDYLKDISVELSFTDSAGKEEKVTSPIFLISKTGDVSIDGLEKEGQVYGVNTSDVKDLYKIYERKYQWYADGVALPGAVQKQRTLSTIESGKNIKIEFSYVDGRGNQEVLTTQERFVYTLKETITPAGGVFENAGVKLNVPSGAVSQNTDVMVYVTPYDQGQLPIGILSDQLAYAFTPLDLTFQQPVEITLSKPNDEYDMIIYGTNNSVEEFTISDDDFITVDNENNKVTIQTENFGVFISSILYVRVDIVGTPEQGQLLDTVFTGEVFSKTYQWYRGDTPILDATGSNYTVVLDDVEEEIKVVSTYLLEEDSSPEFVESEPITIINSDPVADTSIIISGSDRVGEVLTADPSGITDANNPAGLSDFMYQWKVNGQDIQDATSETVTIQPEHFNKNLTVEITYVDAAGLLESVTSDNFFVSRIPPSGFVEVIGTPEVGQYLEVDTDNLVDLNGIGEFSYQWHVEGQDLENATSSSLLVTSDMEDKAISVTLVYTDGVGEVETVTSQNAPVIDAHPTGEVTIDYTILEVAQTLTANTSTIQDANSPSGISNFSYQWKSDGSSIPGANSVNYVVQNQFCNTNITVTVTFTDGDGYVETLTSEPVFIVNSPVQGEPFITGYPGVGETLTINTDGYISDVNVIGALNYKWFANGIQISGATSKQWFVDKNLYVGQAISGEVYYTDQAGNAEQVSSSNALVITNTLPTGQPTVEGTLRVGQTLTALTGAISDSNIIVPPFSYQWYANGAAIQDATGSDYIVQVNDINKSITVDASFYDEGNTFETVTSIGYTIVNTPATGYVSILSSSSEQGTWLTASVSAQDDNVIVSGYSYQWKRDGANIRNATSQYYQLGQGDIGKDITVAASFTDTGGFIETITNSDTANMVDSQPTGYIEIHDSDNAKVGYELTAYTENIQDKNRINNWQNVLTRRSAGSFNWSQNSQNRGYTYNISFSDDPKYITRISIRRDFGNIGHCRVILESTGQWYDLHNLIDFPALNSMSQGQTYHIYLEEPLVITYFSMYSYYQSEQYGGRYDTTVSLWEDPSPQSKVFEYQWNRDGQPIDGATEKTYTPTFDDLYKTLTVDVDFNDLHGNSYRAANTASLYVENSPPEGTVLIHGTRNVGEELYFTHNVVDKDNITVDNSSGSVTFSSYQWYQSDFEDGELTVINDATGSTLLLTPELQAKWIALDATYVDSEGDDDTIHASNRLPVKSTPTGNAIITSEDLQLGRQVFLDTSTIADLNDLGEFSYQWYRTEGTGSVAISGATQTHYSYQPADLGEDIFVTVSYVDGDGDPELLTSNTLGPVVQTSGSVGTITIDSSSEINGEITSDVENIFAMNNFETVAPVVAYNFHRDTRDVSPNGLHLAGTNYAFDADGGLDLSHSTSAYLRTSGTTPVLNNDTHTIAFRVMLKGGTSSAYRKVFSFGRGSTADGSPEIWWRSNSKQLHIDYSPANVLPTTSDLEPDTWYDVMFVKQGGTARVYVDGSLAGEFTGVPNPKLTGDYKLEFGGNSGYGAAPVVIKDFQIFDFAVDDYINATNYPFYTEPTLSYQWKADGNPIAGETSPALQLTDGNNDLGKDITLEVSLTDALGNARTVESNTSVVVGSELVQVERFLLEDGSEMLQEDGSSFLSETITTDIYLPLSVEGTSVLENEEGLVAHFDISSKFSYPETGTVVRDLTVNRNDMTLYNGISYGTTNNGVLSFDSSNDYARFNVSDIEDVLVIETWVNTTNINNKMMFYVSNGLTVYAIDGKFGYNTGNGGDIYGLSSTQVSNLAFLNNWAHFVFEIRPGEHYSNNKIFVNGVEQTLSQVRGTAGTRPSDVSWVQLSHGSYQMPMQVSMIKVYNRTLSQQEITDSYNSGFGNYNNNLQVGETVSVDVSNVTDPNGIANVEYQWYADNTPLLNATGSSVVITSEENNKDIFVKAVFEDGMGRKSARLSEEILVTNTPATGTVTITSTGTFEVGNVLVANVSVSDDNEILSQTFDYQWMMDGIDIVGETRKSYILRNGDVGKNISARISFVDKALNIETITSDEVSILGSNGSGQVQILGQSSVGSILTADTSGVSDPNGILEFIYQWKRDGVAISGETSQSYTLTADDHNKNITVDVSYIDNSNVVFNIDARSTDSYDGSGNTIYDLSDYENNLSRNGNISLIEEKGGLLSFDNSNDWLQGNLKNTAGDWEHTVEFVIKARRNQSSQGSDYDTIFQIGDNATSQTSAFQFGGGYSNWFFYSNDTRIEGDQNIFFQDQFCHVVLSYSGGGGTPTNKKMYVNGIEKTLYQYGGSGQLLQLDANDEIRIGTRANGDNDAYMYLAYFRVYNKGLSQDEVENLYMAQQDLYELPEIAPTGTTNINVVTSNDSVYVDKSSATGTVVIEGTREVLNTLTATNTLADQDGLGTLSYQWYRGESIISGATSSTFDIPRDYVGQSIYVVVSYTDGNGDSETVVSEAVEINNPPIGEATIEGTARKGNTLSVDFSGVVDTNVIPLLPKQENLVFGLDSKLDGAKDYVNDRDFALHYDAKKNSSGYYEFDFSSDYMSLPDHESLDFDGEISISVWFNADRVDVHQQTLIGKGGGWNRTGFLLTLNNNYFRMHLGSGGSERNIDTTSVRFSAHTWNHVIATWRDNYIYVYLNGQLIGTSSAWSNGHYKNNYPLHIGGKAGNSYFPFDGEIAQARVYDAAMTDAEVLEFYNKTKGAFENQGYAFDIDVTYQWQREISAGVYENIANAGGKFYKPTNEDVYRNIRAKIYYTDEQGFNEVVTSQPIYIENTLPEGAITFTGTMKSGNTITANISGVSDDNNISSITNYQWKVNGVPVGQNENTYTIASNEAGRELSLTLTFVDDNGTIESVATSAGIIENTAPENTLTWSNPFTRSIYDLKQDFNGPNESYAYFGDAVAISKDGNTLVVGARGADGSSSNYQEGRFYIYRKNSGGNWEYVTYFEPTGADSSYTGTSVSINDDGTVIAVGAPGYSGNQVGRVWIYQKGDNGLWSHKQEFYASGSAHSSEYFGQSVSLSGDGNILAVGHYRDSETRSYQGSVRILRRNSKNDNFVENQRILQSSPSANDSYEYFGYSVSLSSDGSTLAVGAYGKYNSSRGDNTGAVYVYENNGSTFDHQQYIEAFDPDGSDYFGYSVSVSNDGNTLAVGAHGWDRSGIGNTGAVYVYTRQANTGLFGTSSSQTNKLEASDYGSSDEFGSSVCLSGDGNKLIAGARTWDGSYSNNGAAYIFYRSGNSFLEYQKLAGPSDSSAYFGRAVSMDNTGGTIIVGASYENVGYTDNGRIYIYEEGGTETQPLVPQNLCKGTEISLDTSTITDINGINIQSQKYAWYRLEDGEYVKISENEKYILDAADAGKTLRAEYEYIDGSNKIETLSLDINIPSESLTLNTSLIVGNSLKVNNFSSSDKFVITDNFAYTWKINGEVVSSEEEYEIKPEDLGKKLELEVRVSRDGNIYREFYHSGTVTMSVHSNLTYDFTRTKLDTSMFPSITVKNWPRISRPGPWTGDSDGYGSLSSDFSISGDGNTLAIGAYTADNNGYSDEGAIYIFSKQEDDSWANEIRLQPSVYRAHNLYFGRGFALNKDGTVLAVATYYDADSNYRGRMFIYRKDENGNWNKEYNEFSPFNETVHHFGNYKNISISADGNRIVVGANHADGYYSSNRYRGRFAIYERDNNGTWHVVNYEPTYQNYAHSGQAVAIDPSGEYILVGAPYYDYSYSDSGYAWLYKRNSLNSWSIVKSIEKPDFAEEYANFGWKVALSNNAETLVITAKGADNSSTSEYYYGRAYVYQKGTGNSWNYIQRLEVQSPMYRTYDRDWFGESVAMSEDGSILYVGGHYIGKYNSPSYENGAIARYKKHQSSGAYILLDYQQNPSTSNRYLGREKIMTTAEGDALIAYENSHLYIYTPDETPDFDGTVTTQEQVDVNYGGRTYFEEEIKNYLPRSSEQYHPQLENDLKRVDKVTVNFSQNVEEVLDWKWFVGEKLQTSVTGSSIDITDEIRKFNKIRFEYSYVNHEGEVEKQSGMVHLVDTQENTHEFTAKQGSSFSLDLDTLLPSSTELTILGAELLGGFDLPPWLTYNNSNKVISGTPSDGDANNLAIRVLVREEKTVGSVDYGIVIRVRVASSDENIVTNYKQYDWLGVEDPQAVINQYGLSSTRRWDGTFRFESVFEPNWDEAPVVQDNFDLGDWSGLGYLDSYENWGSDDWSHIAQWGLNPDPTWEGRFQWHNRTDASFGELSEKLLEENFDDLSWTGYARFDWSDIEDPKTEAGTWGLSGYLDIETRFAWKDIYTPEFGELSQKLLEETFEDNSWTGYTRFDWKDVEDPSAVVSGKDFRAHWEGSYDWANNPEPQFVVDTKVVSEEFEDVTWSGYTRVDWNQVEQPSTVSSQYGINAHWEGQFKWSERAQPSFSEKSLITEEDFEDDWTI